MRPQEHMSPSNPSWKHVACHSCSCITYVSSEYF